MVTSIQLNNQLVTSTLHTNTYNQEPLKKSGFAGVFNDQLPKTEQLAPSQFSNRISNINPVDVDALYKSLKQEVKAELDALPVEEKALTSFDYLNSQIDKIMNTPIEVKIDRDEMNKAILYNRMGINYLDVKELEMKMELLVLAKDDVIHNKKQRVIREDQAQQLLNKIERNQTKLAEKIQSLLEGNKTSASEQNFFAQLTNQKNFNL
jgi:predicted transcriptional regulator